MLERGVVTAKLGNAKLSVNAVKACPQEAVIFSLLLSLVIDSYIAMSECLIRCHYRE